MLSTHVLREIPAKEHGTVGAYTDTLVALLVYQFSLSVVFFSLVPTRFHAACFWLSADSPPCNCCWISHLLYFDVVQGMLQFLGGVGWGGVGLITFLCTCRNQAATVKRGRVGRGGVGVGWDNNVIGLAFSCTSTPTSCYAAVRSHALSHIRHATLIGFVATLPHARDMREHTLLGAFS